jgi:histidinol-phosphate aminotransferase
MAGIRLGMAFARPEIIRIFNKIKYPYNINILTQQKALELIEKESDKSAWVNLLINERGKLAQALESYSFVTKIYPSDANFLLVKMKNARKVYNHLVEKRVIVRDRSNVILCEDSLRITVGSPEENGTLLRQLSAYEVPSKRTEL